MKTILARFKVNKNYISETDRFLSSFDQKNPKKSQSQQQEIAEYQKLFARRDHQTQVLLPDVS
jgi:hypothetical protein